MFNDVLKQLRNKAGMNQEQLAKRLGLSKSATVCENFIKYFRKTY